MKYNFYVYLAVTAIVTYLIRLFPILFIRKKIKNRFINSFLYYLPASVLTVMTIPAIFYATSSIVSAVFGFATALVTAYFDNNLLKVAGISCLTVFAMETVMQFI